MKSKILLTILALFLLLSAFGQKASIELTFTAIDSAAYVQLDSVKVMNRTQGSEVVIYWPDTTLTLGIAQGDLLLCIGYAKISSLGMKENHPGNEEFKLDQNYPNPVKNQSLVSLYIPGKGTVNIMVTDLQGRIVINTDMQLDKGHHSFRFVPGHGNSFFLTARWNGVTRSIKILTSEPNSGNQCILDYIGSGNGEPLLKAALLRDGFRQESGILDTPVTNKNYTFQFATNIPCPETPTINYEGQVYHTIQIFSQCWLKENLNVGTMVPGAQEMNNNSITEKYCYDDIGDNCVTYGGLYQWNEMMQYTTTQGVQGICPLGWHLPTDEEWEVLEGAVDSQYGIGDNTWDGSGDRGFDAGTNLKTTNGWNYGGNGADLFGFSDLPGGYRDVSGTFISIGDYGYWWTSSVGILFNAWNRDLYYDLPEVTRGYNYKTYGFSVRCLRDF